MSRTKLLGAVSVAALACLSNKAAAQSNIQGGGSTLAQFVYGKEFAAFNGATGTGAKFANPVDPTGVNQATTLYWPSGSATGQAAFLANNNGLNRVAVLGGTAGTGAGRLDIVDYGASDVALSAGQIAQWAVSTVGQAPAGNLIQLPAFGTPIAIPVVNSAVTANSKVVAGPGILLTADQLCGIFSGKLTDWSQVTQTKATLAPGPINVVYRSDDTGTTLILTNHLSAVCATGAGGNANIAFSPTTSFASLFAGGVPANFSGRSGSDGVANYMAGLSSGQVTSAIGYLTPDFTSIVTNGDAVLSNGQRSPLLVAALQLGSHYYLPTSADADNGLSHAGTGQNLTSPVGAKNVADPAKWVPLIQTVTTGYPIVGYTTFDFAQCYADSAVGRGVISFLKSHYKATSYAAIITRNGFVRTTNRGAAAFVTAISGNIVANTQGYNTDINNATACVNKAGRY